MIDVQLAPVLIVRLFEFDFCDFECVPVWILGRPGQARIPRRRELSEMGSFIGNTGPHLRAPADTMNRRGVYVVDTHQLAAGGTG